MKYRKAESVLPQELLEQIQQYIQGEYVYIPNKKGMKKAWGEKTGTRHYIAERNVGIKKQYYKGKKCEELAMEYHLSLASIRKIVYGNK
ncbi:CD3324 family protein [Zhenhengia yiwuensis]|uniref:Mor transcription activator family protein n=1 Tax=Zhenhengia yiwuensis TaxID=2763666 RepID=A0A926ICH1_9FIRM|nr:CD3324 family protein [Zhenhengia yiwuensis]MBC8578677.1 hypothetical protein [Zhenhengia yiwuensis]